MPENQEIIKLSSEAKSWPFVEAQRILKRIEKKASGDLTESEIKEFYGEINLDNYQSQINKLVNNDPELIEFFNYNEQSLNNCLYIID